MKVVIFCGGRGARMDMETEIIPKPMVDIGGKPVLWHIMKIYSRYGFNEFILCLGYKGHLIKEYFSHYFLYTSDVTIDMSKNSLEVHSSSSEPWKITLVDTGMETMTGGRLKKVEKYTAKEPFMLTYGDGVGDVDIKALVDFHKKGNKLATLTAVQNAGRFGVVDIDEDNNVRSFLEKPKGEGSWISAGFFVLEPGVFKYINKGDSAVWEKEPLSNLAHDGQLNMYKHSGFWQCMDTQREKMELESLWNSPNPPWKVW